MILLRLAIKTILCSLILAPLLPSADPVAIPEFRAERGEGPVVQGKLRELGKGWAVQLGEGKEGAIPAGDLISLRRVGVLLPPLPEEAHVVLVQGDTIPVVRPRIANERLFFRHTNLDQGKEVSVPLSSVAMLWLEPPAAIDEVESWRRRQLSERRKRDRVLLVNGDTLEGDLVGLDEAKATLENGKKSSTIEVKQIGVLLFNSDLADKARPKGVYAEAVLLPTRRTEGCRLLLRDARLEGTDLEGETLFGAHLKVPLDQLAALDLLQGRAVYLSELKPTRYDFTPYLNLSWPLGVDCAVTGKDLRLAGSLYSRGLGMHARSQVRYILAGDCRRFEALVGLDTQESNLGSARIRIMADGKEVNLAGKTLLDARHPLYSLQVPLVGVKELTLETDFGPSGNVQARVNWADARLIR